MFFISGLNNEINNVHEKALKITFNDKLFLPQEYFIRKAP